jgi:hypothetical protein
MSAAAGPEPDHSLGVYDAHLAADDQRLAQMEITTGQDSMAYYEAWCDRMSYAHNCYPRAPGPVPEADLPGPEPEAEP